MVQLILGQTGLKRGENGFGPTADQATVGLRHTQKIADNFYGQTKRKLFHHFHLACICQTIQISINQPRNARHKGIQCLAGKGRLKKLADSRVIGWIGEHDASCVMFKERTVAKFWPESAFLVRRPQHRVAINMFDVCISRQNKAAVRVRINGRFGAQIGQDAVRIGDISIRNAANIKLSRHRISHVLPTSLTRFHAQFNLEPDALALWSNGKACTAPVLGHG